MNPKILIESEEKSEYLSMLDFNKKATIVELRGYSKSCSYVGKRYVGRDTSTTLITYFNILPKIPRLPYTFI